MMGHLTTQERVLIAFVMIAVLIGAITKFWRDRAALREDSPSKDKFAHESPVERE
jgi:hypothetical protein